MIETDQSTNVLSGSCASAPDTTTAKGLAANSAPHSRSARRPTKDERAERVDYAIELLCRCLLKSQIKTLFRRKFGDLGKSTIERYLAKAREVLLAGAGGKEEMRARARGFYESVIRDPQASHRDKILAQERIDRLYGLEAPLKVAPTDASGENPYVGLDKEELIRMIINRAEAQAEVKELEDLYERDSD